MPSGATTELTALERWRSDTPGAAHRIHLNNAGAALMPNAVIDAVRSHLELESRIGGYEAADRASAAIRQVYRSVAGLIGAKARNVAIVENATVAVAQALSSVRWRRGDRIVTSRQDYSSNQLMYRSLGRRFGVKTVRIPESDSGPIDLAAARRLIRAPRTRLVSLSWMPTNSGLVQPVAELGRLCAEAGAPYLIDACQAAGQIPIDVGALECDFLAATARKFLRGPRGVGFLFVADRALERGVHPLFIDMRGADWVRPNSFALVDSARRFENWESSYQAVLGLGAAVDYASGVGIERAHQRSWALAALVRDRIRSIRGAVVQDRGPVVSAIVTATFRGRDPTKLVQALRERGINVHQSAREDALIDMDAKGIRSCLRISPHYYNTEGEIDSAVEALADLAL